MDNKIIERERETFDVGVNEGHLTLIITTSSHVNLEHAWSTYGDIT